MTDISTAIRANQNLDMLIQDFKELLDYRAYLKKILQEKVPGLTVDIVWDNGTWQLRCSAEIPGDEQLKSQNLAQGYTYLRSVFPNHPDTKPYLSWNIIKKHAVQAGEGEIHEASQMELKVKRLEHTLLLLKEAIQNGNYLELDEVLGYLAVQEKKFASIEETAFLNKQQTFLEQIIKPYTQLGILKKLVKLGLPDNKDYIELIFIKALKIADLKTVSYLYEALGHPDLNAMNALYNTLETITSYKTNANIERVNIVHFKRGMFK